MRTLAIDRFREILPRICNQETSVAPNGWTPENPLFGHCAVVSLVAQNLFGGELLCASLEAFPKFAHIRSHYWNKLPDGNEYDFTSTQFGAAYPNSLVAEVRSRSHVLSSHETMMRYKLLCLRLAGAVYEGNLLFSDSIYALCIYVALDSPCQKMKFGCVLARNGRVVCAENNHFIEPLRSLCEPTCIRLSLKSRTESMLGACGHAEEHAIWHAIRNGVPTNECDLYVAGVYPNGLPWLEKEAAEHTCLRCSVLMHYAQIRNIFVPFKDRWWRLGTEEALSHSRAYATREKTIGT